MVGIAASRQTLPVWDMVRGVTENSFCKNGTNITSPSRQTPAAKAAETDDDGSTERSRSDVDPRITHQAETQGVSDGRQQGDVGKCPHRRIGNRPESDSGHGREHPVEQIGRAHG